MIKKYDPIMEELSQGLQNLMALWKPLRLREVCVTQHPPGNAPTDITDQYEEGFRIASDALNKAIAILGQLEA